MNREDYILFIDGGLSNDGDDVTGTGQRHQE